MNSSLFKIFDDFIFRIHFAVIVCSLSFTGIIHAQTYPVQTFVQVSPPYNSYLPDYANPFTNQMRVLLTLTDFAVPSAQVKLRFHIEGSGYSLHSTDLVAFPTITLSPGVPVEISGSQLAPYLATENLVFSGLSAAEYEISKVLPEGPASICVEVVDVSSVNQPVVGNPACAQTWFSLYDPPLINLPFCGSEITTTDPQAVLFTWTPLHMASPLAGLTEYVFELFEMRPDGSDPNVVVESSLPIYIEMTTNPLINYGILQPPLQVGMTYVWRVQARDPSGRDLYRNHGYTEVCTFTYGSIAGSLIDGITLELNANGTGVRQGLAWWNGSDLFESYELELRKTGDDGYAWFPYSTEDKTLKINSLEPKTEYECRVKGITGSASSDWSNIATFTTQSQNSYACGSTALPAVSPINKPLDFLLPGNIVAVGQFEMVVYSAEPAIGEGRYNGTGKINVPFAFTNLAVSFNNIYIDEDMVMRDGRVEALTQDLDEWIDESSRIFIPGIINQGGFEFNEDSTVTVHFGDESRTYDFPKNGGPIVFEDESGLIYTVYPDGTIEIEGAITWDDDVLAATSNHLIVFQSNHEQVYGFDDKQYNQWTKNYPCIKLSDGSLYFTAYKSVASSKEDYVNAVIRSEIGISSPTFIYDDGTILSAIAENDSTYRLSVGNTVTSKFIYALDDTGARIGKLNLSVYANKSKQLIVVPVNDAEVPEGLEASINDIFDQANVTFDITIAENYEDHSYDIDENGLESPSTTLMDKYSSEMKAIRDNYFETHDEVADTYYIFVVPEFDSDMDGYMVRGKALGFVKSGETPQTYAHELGHGVFGLEHTFPTIPQATTNNLLDYSVGATHLTHKQWYDMQHFTPVFSFLDNEEDGSMAVVHGSIPTNFRNIDGSMSFITPSGSIITIPESSTNISFYTLDPLGKKIFNEGYEYLYAAPIGTLRSFTCEINNTQQTFVHQINGDKLIYQNQSNEEVYIDSLSYQIVPTDIIVGFPMYDGTFKLQLFYVNVEETIPYQVQFDAEFAQNEDNKYRSNFSTDGELIDCFSIIEQLFGKEMLEGDNLEFYEEYLPEEDVWYFNPSRSKWDTFFSENNGIILDGELKPMPNGLGLSYIEKLQSHTKTGNPLGPIIISIGVWIEVMDGYGIYDYLDCTTNSSASIESFVAFLDVLYTINPPIQGYEPNFETPNEILELFEKLQLELYNFEKTLKTKEDVNKFIEVLGPDQSLIAASFIKSIYLEDQCRFSEINLKNKLKLFDLIVKDDDQWEYDDLNLLTILFNFSTSNHKKEILEGLRSKKWLKSINDQLFEWTDLRDDKDYYAIQDLFAQFTEFYSKESENFDVTHQKKKQYYTNDNPSYVANLEPSSALHPSKPVILDFLPKQYIVETNYNNYPIFIGTHSGPFNIFKPNPGLEESVFANISKDEIPFEFNGESFIINGNYKLASFNENAIPVPNTYAEVNNPENVFLSLKEDYNIDPFEVVEICFTSTYGSQDLQIGQSLVIPAYELILYEKAVTLNKIDLLNRLVTDAVQIGIGLISIITAPASAGASLLAFTALIAVIDGAIQIDRANPKLTLSEYNSSFYNNWDNFKMVVDLAELAVGAPSLIRFISNFDIRRVHNFKHIFLSQRMNRIIRKTPRAPPDASITEIYRTAKYSESIRTGKTLMEIEDIMPVFDDLFESFKNLPSLKPKSRKFIFESGWDKTVLTKLDEDLGINEFRVVIDGDVELAEAWKRLYDLGEDVIPLGLRTNLNFLTKFDNLAKNNNLRLSAADIEDILKAPNLKTGSNGLPLKWDDPEAVLDAIKRTSDSGTSGVTISHKKFPTPSEGNESFVLKNAKQYQSEASGDAGLSFDKGERSFDNVASDGTLIDRKYGHGSSVFNPDLSIKNQTRANSILDQAEAQIYAANGAPVKWEVSTKLGADGIQNLFDIQGIDIEVVFVPQQTIVN